VNRVAAIRGEDFDLFGIGGEPRALAEYSGSEGGRGMDFASLDTALDEELTEHRNPATGREEVYLRQRHNEIRSPRLKAMLACVSRETRGKHFRGYGPVADERMVHEALARASRLCSAETAGQAPSRR